ncbi:mixed lineage kinase domain-like protein [Xiphophorus couchianus]|uniref:mixed lineage kinase domain-like protein n=1 Tax=Xiphophorus couchianus TaxID=32473 RepID=UPI0010165F01|nr:mixed lineage kinase domain-like protein [Xiphophorus couchianus]XP_027885748.1 mixed lineage kinase domain-like protein [Xiphophorus couchianus]
MDFVKDIVGVVKTIYELAEKVKANQSRWCRIRERVKALEELVDSADKNILENEQVQKALEELLHVLKSAQAQIGNYANASCFRHVIKSNSYEEEFDTLNKRLSEVFERLSLALQLDQRSKLFKVFELANRQREDEEDRKKDIKELQRLLINYKESLDMMQKDLEEIKTNVIHSVELLKNPTPPRPEVRMIKPEELTYIPDYPKTPFMKTPRAEIYTGRFSHFPVAIKRYTEALNAKPEEIKSEFFAEVDSLKQFESPNILRMFGICIKNEERPNPEYYIIMEYCAQGTLQNFLFSRQELPWDKKVGMCLDAAQGVYRLHHVSGQESKLHMNIRSENFLVDENNKVKLGGLEHSQTVQSLKKRKEQEHNDKNFSSLCYSAPELLRNTGHEYGTECDIYSLGIVLWEIATWKKPFQDFNGNKITLFQKVCFKKYQEPLPQHCPESLEKVISACRSYDPFQRLSAGALVDKLQLCLLEVQKL